MPAAAATPQEGWFVRDKITYGGKEYFVIDNKLSADPWYVELRTMIYYSPNPYIVTPYDRTPVDASQHILDWSFAASIQDSYDGFSDVGWFVDDDWRVQLTVSGLSVQYLNGAAGSGQVYLLAYDKSVYPLVSYDFTAESPHNYSGTISYQSPVVFGPSVGSSVRNNIFSPLGVLLSDNSVKSFSLDSFSTYFPFFQDFSGTSWTPGTYSLNSVSINNLRFFVSCAFNHSSVNANAGAQYPIANCYARVAFTYLCPVDKAPAGTQVGDSWPKQRPIEVQMEDAYSAWMDSALQNTPYGDASNVGTGIQGYNQQLEESDNWGTLATEGWQGIAPIFDSFDFVFTILAIVGVTFILLLLIKKGMA